MTTGPDISLDSDGDIRLVNGDLVMESNIAQSVAIRLRTLSGEWFLDESIGVPYFQEILGKQENLDQIEAVIRNEVLEVDGVIEVDEFTITTDSKTRTLSVNITIVGENGIEDLGDITL